VGKARPVSGPVVHCRKNGVTGRGSKVPLLKVPAPGVKRGEKKNLNIEEGRNGF